MKNICCFIDDRNCNPIKEFINKLPIKEKGKVLACIEELSIQGHNLRRPLADYLRDGIYELRPKKNRIFYFFFLKDNIVLLHAIRKNTQAIPEKDIKLCLKRKNQIINTKKLEIF